MLSKRTIGFNSKHFPLFTISTLVFLLILQSLSVFITTVHGASSSWSFSSSSDYTYDSDAITFTSGKAELKAPSDWYSDEWAYRKKLTVDNTKVSSDLTNFPLLVNFTSDSDLATSAQDDGDDIVFTSSNGTTQLSHEIEEFSGDTGSLVSWVNMPNIADSTDTDLYMYFGNSGASNQESGTDVWDSNFKSVMHMSEETSTPVAKFAYINDVEYGDVDSTGNEYYRDSDDRLQDLVDEMNNNYLPDFVISNSDYVQGHTSEATTLTDLQYIESIFDDLTMPRYYALGNHELSHLSKAQFIANTGMEEEYYSYDVNGWHFVVLDYTYNPNGTPFDHDNFAWTEAIIPQEQLDWLEDDLAATSYPTIVFVGKDLGASANGANLMGVSVDSVTINNAPEIRAILEGAGGKVRLAMVPEAGINAHNKINNINYIMNFGFNSGEYTGTNLHYAKVELYADGSIEIIGNGSQYSYWMPVDDKTVNTNHGMFFGKHGEDKSVQGKIGGSLDFDGADDMMISGSTDSLDITSAITLESWVNLDQYNQTVNTNGVIVSKRTNLSNSVIDPYRLYALLFNGTTGRPRFSLSSGTTGTAVSLIADSAIPTGTWVHLAATYDGTNMRIYQNGTQVKSGTGFSGNIGSSEADITMGRYNTSEAYPNDRLNGKLDELRISDTYRSPEWISTSYNNQNSPNTFYGTSSTETPFSTDDPIVTPKSENAIDFTSLSAFAETATKNDGEIKYQLSNDSGNTWYWYNSGWNSSNGTYSEANTASSINTNISTLPLGEGSLLFKAHLHSDGAQQVQLDEVTLTYSNDSTPPVISGITQNIGSDYITIDWNTNEIASTKVDYGITNTYGSSTPEADTSPRVTGHSATLSNLLPCTNYNYRVRSTDSFTNETIDSNKTFTTLGCTGAGSVIQQVSRTIQRAIGGIVELLLGQTGVELTIPVDFSSLDTTFQIKKLDAEEVLSNIDSPEGFDLVGGYLYELKALTGVSDLVSEFDESLTIAFTYKGSDVEDFDESSLVVYRWDGTLWHKLTDCVVDQNENTVTCTTTEFSAFALYGEALAADVDETSEEPENTSNALEETGNSMSEPILIGSALLLILVYFNFPRKRQVTSDYAISFRTAR